ncbi:MAG: hypothetical protein IJQ06_08250, partial [Paludibacteraceae bacterium]|nr:hypothetical protein [Paludibacteraceae bacterium]
KLKEQCFYGKKTLLLQEIACVLAHVNNFLYLCTLLELIVKEKHKKDTPSPLCKGERKSVESQKSKVKSRKKKDEKAF